MDNPVKALPPVSDPAASRDETFPAPAFHLPGGRISLQFCICDLTGLVLLKEFGDFVFIRQAKGSGGRRECVTRPAGDFHPDGYLPEALPDIGLRKRRSGMGQAKKTDEGKKDFHYGLI
jgi:hypothetical protein